MSIELREALNAAFDEETKDESTPVETSRAEETPSAELTETDKTEVIADEVPPDSTNEKVQEKPAGEKAPDKVAPAALETVPGTTHRVDRAPASWKKEAKGEWAALPLQARQEIHRREMEVQRVLNETAPIRKEVEEFRNTVAPYMARIQSLGVTPTQAVAHLLNTEYAMATGNMQQKAKAIDKLLQDYDIDLNVLDQVISSRLGGQPQPGGVQQPQVPDVQALVQQQLQQALAPLYQQQQREHQRVVQQAVQTVEQMALDPKYPYFEDVRSMMADIVDLNRERGVEIPLDQAYKMAVNMNPELSSMTQATQLHSRAQRAAAAGASVSGNPVGGGQQAHVTSGNLRDDIEAAFGGAANRV
jgi:hypothetical protein